MATALRYRYSLSAANLSAAQLKRVSVLWVLKSLPVRVREGFRKVSWVLHAPPENLCSLVNAGYDEELRITFTELLDSRQRFSVFPNYVGDVKINRYLAG